MMKTIKFILLIVLAGISIGLQGNPIPSVNDSTRVNLLNHRAQTLVETNPEVAVSLASEAKDLAE